VKQWEYAGSDLLGSKWFADISMRASRNGAQDLPLRAFGGNNNHRNISEEGFESGLLKKHQAVHAGHVDVGEDEPQGFVAPVARAGFLELAARWLLLPLHARP